MFQLALFENTQDFFVKGGVFMAVLLVCSFVAFTVILLRSFALRRRAVRMSRARQSDTLRTRAFRTVDTCGTGHDKILMSLTIGRRQARLASQCRDSTLQHCAFEYADMLAGGLHPA